ncbi:Stage II sporulation protein E (SpoIIE) [Thiorhodovibrio winogradskyi]|uniref:Stage II sporulation protein E (SpoIIE) n=1 Tax=Thiorhodovibrio winogradskyi TaxID=77007 RepID=A0ABZ0SB23_9GAMM|nr:SpoIIE family protein phosphatase [Thiorhodovibrio winogradskyi]
MTTPTKPLPQSQEQDPRPSLIESQSSNQRQNQTRLRARVSYWRGLTFKQAAITLMAVSLLSFSAGALQLYLQWRDLRVDLRAEIDRVLALVRGSATEAAYQMHPELARQLIDGLSALPALASAELRDNFGSILAEIQLAPASPPSALATTLAPAFADVIHYRLVLHDTDSMTNSEQGSQPDSQQISDTLGTLSLRLSPDILADRFLAQASTNLLVTTVQILLVSALVVALFYWMITRPILRLSDTITAVDPAAPGHWRPPRLRGHAGDELGMLNQRIADLLAAFQRGLHQRDTAERDLRALTEELEDRVRRRTTELQRVLGDLNQQKTALEHAFRELDSTHAKLTETNAQVLASIDYARRIQNAILPAPERIAPRDAEILVHWEPLQAVGGDWYWFESLPGQQSNQQTDQKGHWTAGQQGGQQLILLADCTGHGVPGALMTLVVASALERILHEQKVYDPVNILHALDHLVRQRLRQDHEHTQADDGLEAAVLCLDPDGIHASFASAGIALIRLGMDDQARVYRGAHAQLGYASLPPPGQIERHGFSLAPGDLCLLLSDGMTDQMGGEPTRLLGRRRFIELLKQSRQPKLADWIQALVQSLAAYRGHQARRDDMTLIAVRKTLEPANPADKRRPGSSGKSSKHPQARAVAMSVAAGARLGRRAHPG